MNAPDPWAFGWTQLLTLMGFAITICIAVGGFRTFGRWKREKLEERRIEIAFDLLAMAYEAKHVFNYIRSPMAYEYEWEDLARAPGETDDGYRRRGTFYVALKRINNSKDFFERFVKLHPRCMTVFGPGVEQIFMLLHRSRREIEVSAQMLMANRAGVRDDTIEQWEHDVWEKKRIVSGEDSPNSRGALRHCAGR